MMGWGGIICCVWYTGVALKLKDAPIPTKPKDPWSVETTILFSTTLKRQFSMRLYAHCEAKEFNENSLLELLGKPLSICPHLYVGIAQIAITPPPALKRALWGTFFQVRFYHFTIF